MNNNSEWAYAKQRNAGQLLYLLASSIIPSFNKSLLSVVLLLCASIVITPAFGQSNPAAVALKAAGGDNKVDLSWTATGNLKTIQIYRDGDANPAGRKRLAILRGNVRNYTDDTAVNGQQYWYWIKYNTSSDNKVGNSNAGSATPTSNTPNNTPDSSPAAVTLKATGGNGRVDLSWTVTGDLKTIQVYRDVDANPAGRTRLATLKGSARSYSDTTAVNGKQYWYWIKYFTASSGGKAGNSNAGTATPTDNSPKPTPDQGLDTVTKRKFDFVVGVDGDFKAARVAASNAGGNRFIIFFPNGEYDLGAQLFDSDNYQTTDFRPGNVSFIGQDNEKTVIFNKAKQEGLGTSPTLRLHGDNIYLQDVALQNKAKIGTGRFTVIDERGKHTIYKNVRMLSGQDTYYTKGDKTYWEGGEIHGTTDFICGQGDIYFNEVLLWTMKKSAITAPANHNRWGYVFNNCTIDGTVDGYDYGRNWNGGISVFLNTTMNRSVSSRGWGDGINGRTNEKLLAEYNSRTADGRKVDTSKRASRATILSTSEAAQYTIENVLGGWDPRKDTKQVAAPVVRQDGTSITWNNAPDALCWVVFRNGEYLANVTSNSYNISSIGAGERLTVRAANKMGGLGAVSNSVTVEDVNGTGNHPPVAKIGAAPNTMPGQTVTLDGSDSSDPDGDTLTYLWTQTRGGNISLADNSSPTLYFVAPSVNQPAQYTFSLTVSDGELEDQASVTVLVAPASTAGLCDTANEGNSLTLTCPSGEVITKVNFASYGTPGGSCGMFTTGRCNAGSSMSVVSDACKGRNSCTLYAGNDTFGDPCKGTRKKLAAEVACGTGTDTEPDPAPQPTPDPDTGTDGKRLPQDGNPVHSRFNKYKNYIDKADNVLSYQLDCGGWPKNVSYDSPGKGGSGKGTFDNGATTMELTLMADAYNRTGDTKYLKSARKALDYIFEAQYPEGGWPQFYPLRGGYSDHVTFNDHAMTRTMTLLQKALDKTPPFHTDVFTDTQRSKLQGAINRGIDYILKAQYVQNGKKATWCAQHGKSDYEPKKARSYEWPSLSGSESVEIIGVLMFVPQTPEIKQAAINAVNWFNSPDTYLQDYAYENHEFVRKPGSRVWARFHDLETNKPVFSTYDAPMYVGLEHQDKKKPGYSWGGTWGEKIISYAKRVGYIE